jgi:hypothetical protein
VISGMPRTCAFDWWRGFTTIARPSGYGPDEAAGYGAVRMHCVGTLHTQHRPLRACPEKPFGLEGCGRLIAHALSPRHQVLLDYTVYGLDARPPSHRQRPRSTRRIATVNHQRHVRADRQRVDLRSSDSGGDHELLTRPPTSDWDHPRRHVGPEVSEVRGRRGREQLLATF